MSQGTKTIRINEHVCLDKRERSSKWQARVKLADGTWHRFSTKTEDQDRAADVAMKFFYTAEDRLKNKLPQSTRKFRRVAEFARNRMQSELDAGGGNIVFKLMETFVGAAAKGAAGKVAPPPPASSAPRRRKLRRGRGR